ncbi:hypothetical protein AVEN_139947-1 [Araneus ventricosus]|uniref:Uncharacterized protein n=1 Tax=Araneus ventricosus TaxID=182803 RepID=A0A4Y2SPK8_ARAVE|nr:hypothetical protein AVEN_139947-1 [Araneus ventricosus]
MRSRCKLNRADCVIISFLFIVHIVTSLDEFSDLWSQNFRGERFTSSECKEGRGKALYFPIGDRSIFAGNAIARVLRRKLIRPHRQGFERQVQGKDFQVNRFKTIPANDVGKFMNHPVQSTSCVVVMRLSLPTYERNIPWRHVIHLRLQSALAIGGAKIAPPYRRSSIPTIPHTQRISDFLPSKRGPNLVRSFPDSKEGCGKVAISLSMGCPRKHFRANRFGNHSRKIDVEELFINHLSHRV